MHTIEEAVSSLNEISTVFNGWVDTRAPGNGLSQESMKRPHSERLVVFTWTFSESQSKLQQIRQIGGHPHTCRGEFFQSNALAE